MLVVAHVYDIAQLKSYKVSVVHNTIVNMLQELHNFDGVIVLLDFLSLSDGQI